MNKYLLYIYIFILLLNLYIIIHNYNYSYKYNYNYNYIENFNSVNIEIVVSRYNEDLKWINQEPFNKYPITVYNKGINDNFNIKSNHKVIKLENVGRCDHTYLYHIIHNYNNLADITIFLPGSSQMSNKFEKSLRLISEVEKNNNTVFICNDVDDIKKHFYEFHLNDYGVSDTQNIIEGINNQFKISEIRPFGKWYEKYFGDLKVKYFSFSAILGIAKRHILNYPVEHYERFLNELSTSSNPEVGHYIERSWCAILHPLDDAIFIT